MYRKHRLLIGGIGDDAHSVGIRLLALAFKEAGFFVKNLGIRNDPTDFLSRAKDFDVIMISNNNGHAELYLHDFGESLSGFNLTSASKKLWYLGGNLSVSESEFQIKKRFIEMGFTNVFPKPISLEQIIEEVKRDLIRHKIAEKEARPQVEDGPFDKSEGELENVSDERWSAERLAAERKVVLEEWTTGREVALNREAPSPRRDLDWLLWRAKVEGRLPLLQPRTGVASLDNQIEILTYLERSGIDVASVQLDAASRSKHYQKAKEAIELSERRKSSALNGFPIPVHGVSGVRRLVNSLNIPFQLRAGGPDHRFTYEVALSGGATGVEGGFICYLFPYDKVTKPSESLKNWQYIDRLCAVYHQTTGVAINREYFGTLTANLIEPSLAIAVNIVQAILSAKQGVRSISVGYAEQGNRAQDIAAISVLEEMTNRYLKKHGQSGLRVTTVFHQFMAAFPKDEAKAEDLIFNSAVTAALAGATKIMTKTHVEAFKIPSMFENARGVATVRTGLRSAGLAHYDAASIEVERRMLGMQVTQLMNAIEELGAGSIARGAIKAFKEGCLDIPFAPNRYNRNEVITLRDCGGAVRFAEFGNLPFENQIKDFHRGRIEERKTLERDVKTFSLLEKDLTRIWKNDYLRWPLDDTYVV
jgi:methylaspartate mutase E subunit/methylaspartate mutase S subunit